MKKKSIGLFTGMFVLLMLIFSFADLSNSLALFNRDNKIKMKKNIKKYHDKLGRKRPFVVVFCLGCESYQMMISKIKI